MAYLSSSKDKGYCVTEQLLWIIMEMAIWLGIGRFGRFGRDLTDSIGSTWLQGGFSL